MDLAAASVEGYSINAADGFVGLVGVARDEPGGAYLIALCGPWNGGRSLMIPAGVISSVEPPERAVRLDCSRRQLGDAPAYESDRYQDAAYRGELAAYYESLAPASGHAGANTALAAAPGVTAPPAAAFGDRCGG